MTEDLSVGRRDPGCPEAFGSRLSRRTFLLGMAGLYSTITLPLPADSAVGLYEPFAFALVSDAHLAIGVPDSFKLVHESQLFLQDVIKDLNQDKLDFVIFGGDQVDAPGRDDSNWQLFLDVVQSLNAPWSFVLGECDVTDQMPVDKLRTYGPDWKGRGIETAHAYWSHDPLPGVHIIGLDTSRANSATGDVGRRQLEWLQNDLEKNKRKFTIVFSHHPLLPPPPYDGGPPWDEYICAQGPAVREVLGKSPKVRLAVSGHVHVSHVQQERDIWYVSSPSLDVYPCAYRIFRVTPENITVETYQINFPALIKKARKNLEESTLARKYDQSRPERFLAVVEGERKDNDVLLPLAPGAAAQPLPKKKKKKGKPAKKEKKPPEKKPEPQKPDQKKPGVPDKPEEKKPAEPSPDDTPPADVPAPGPDTGAPPAAETPEPAAPTAGDK